MASKKRQRKESLLPEAPDRLSKRAKAVWNEVLSQHGKNAKNLVGPLLEEYCAALALTREAHERIASEGMIVSDTKGLPIDHPALAIAARAQRTVERLAPKFQPPADRRREGYLARKTRESVRAAGLNEDPKFSGAVAGTMTLALAIDMAQAQGTDVFIKTAYGPVQSYLQALEKLGLTPTVSVASENVSSSSASAVPAESAMDRWRQRQQGKSA